MSAVPGARVSGGSILGSTGSIFKAIFTVGRAIFKPIFTVGRAIFKAIFTVIFRGIFTAGFMGAIFTVIFNCIFTALSVDDRAPCKSGYILRGLGLDDRLVPLSELGRARLPVGPVLRADHIVRVGPGECLSADGTGGELARGCSSPAAPIAVPKRYGRTPKTSVCVYVEVMYVYVNDEYIDRGGAAYTVQDGPPWKRPNILRRYTDGTSAPSLHC
jgi:hypothetical protein